MDNTLDKRKAAQNISIRFKDNSQKFSGALGDFRQEYLEEITTAAEEYNLPGDLRLKFVRHILRGNAKQHYIREIQPKAASFDEAGAMMESFINSITRQKRIENQLSNFRIDPLLSDHTVIEAICYLDEKISKLTPQCPHYSRSAQHKINFLHQAVAGHIFARHTIHRLDTGNLSYQEFLSQLDSSAQRQLEEKEHSFYTSFSLSKLSKKANNNLLCTDDKYTVPISKESISKTLFVLIVVRKDTPVQSVPFLTTSPNYLFERFNFIRRKAMGTIKTQHSNAFHTNFAKI
ncbi:unnamed protein product [Agarophyton chilense]